MKKYLRTTPEGTRDLLFEECSARKNVESALTALFKSRGYSKVITPVLEYFDVFSGESAGFAPESMYKLTDNHGRLLVLRPDSTMPIARIVTTRLREASLPIRLYYNQSVFRCRQSLAGHANETVQCGIELIGAKGLRSDLEVISTAIDALQGCGAADFRIEIGHAGFFKSLANALDADDDVREEISELIESKNYAALNDLLDLMPQTDVTVALKRLPRLFGGAEILEEAAELYDSEEAHEALKYLGTIYSSLSQLGLGEKITIDLGLVHRSNYYTGTVFRGYIEGSGITVLSGGRYDGLIGEFGRELPATGFGVDVDALAKAMLQRGEAEGEKAADVLVFGEDGYEINALIYAREITDIVAEIFTGSSLDEAREYAEKKGIRAIHIIGKDGFKIERTGGKKA